MQANILVCFSIPFFCDPQNSSLTSPSPSLPSLFFSVHLHGHRFMIVHRSFDITSNDTTLNPPVVEGQL